MAPLRCAAKFDPFLSSDCAPRPPRGAIQGKEGIKFCYLATLSEGTPNRGAFKVESGDRSERRKIHDMGDKPQPVHNCAQFLDQVV